MSLDILSNLHKKRKASQMEDSGDTYEATHIRPSIKDDSGMSTDDSPTSSVGSSPRALPIKQALSTSKVLQGRSSANGNRGVTIFGPSPILHDSSGVFDKSADWPGDDRQKATNLVDRRVSSSSTELSMWDVSESETHTTDKEEESSDGESVGSAFSPGMDRGKSVKSEESPQGSDYLQRGKSNYTSSRRSAIQEQDYIPSAEPTEPVINGHDRTEHTTRQNRRISHNHDDRISDEPDAIPANGSIRRNIETTTKGKRRQRAAAKTHISARDISHSWRTANAADKMLVKMKAKGCSWLEIRKAWEELTGEWPATSTLPNRYSRVKNNLMRLKSGDVCVFPSLLFSLPFFHLLTLLFGLSHGSTGLYSGTEEATRRTWLIIHMEDYMWASCSAKFPESCSQ